MSDRKIKYNFRSFVFMQIPNAQGKLPYNSRFNFHVAIKNSTGRSLTNITLVATFNNSGSIKSIDSSDFENISFKITGSVARINIKYFHKDEKLNLDFSVVNCDDNIDDDFVFSTDEKGIELERSRFLRIKKQLRWFEKTKTYFYVVTTFLAKLFAKAIVNKIVGGTILTPIIIWLGIHSCWSANDKSKHRYTYADTTQTVSKKESVFYDSTHQRMRD